MSECKIDVLGTHRWHANGVYHRETGPARVYPNGCEEWWLNNKQYTREEFVLLKFSQGELLTNV